MSDTVFLTGATGFVGGHVLEALLRNGYGVRALVRGDASRVAPREGCDVVPGDVLRAGDLVAALRGCRYLVHAAALYSLAPRDRDAIARVNVLGTQSLLEAARIAGVERAIVTSSSAAVGPAPPDRLADERDWPTPHPGAVSYHASKVAQERAALAARIPVTTVLPTAPVGPGDARPTPTGRMILDVMRRRVPAYLDGGMNVVDVRDVAAAHVLALQHGRPRERYIAGGTNLSLRELFARIAAAAGVPAPRVRMPYAVAVAAAWADAARVRAGRGEPAIPLEGVRMGRLRMHASSEKAKRELGYTPHPVDTAIVDAVRWYRQHARAA